MAKPLAILKFTLNQIYRDFIFLLILRKEYATLILSMKLFSIVF